MEWYSWYICGMLTVVCCPVPLFLVVFGALTLWGMVLDLLDWIRR